MHKVLIIFALYFFNQMPLAQDMASSQQRAAEIIAFSQAGLPSDLHNELIQLSNQRDSFNQTTAQLDNEYRSLTSQANQWFANNCQNISSRAQFDSCDSARDQYDARFSNLSSRQQSHNSGLGSFISAYESFKARANAALQQNLQNAQAAAGQSYALAYQQGLTDARTCYPSNAYGFCGRYSANEQTTCVDGYRQGFTAGDQIKTESLNSAYQQGRQAALAEQSNDSFNEEQASGSCRLEWIKAFNQGHFESRITP